MGFSHPEYTVIKELGRGASGVVYLAVQKQLNRRVAVKVIEDPLALPATRQRFLREARILAQLDHPHILPVYELSELIDQPGYLLAMAYIEGGTLRQRAAELTLSQALLVVKQIAEALGFAHKAGFVHRDVKPDNILFQHDQAMLADFGIARPTESQTQMTQYGTILGTPTYISPEQVNGGVVDARSDLYCLGIVLYELLAGSPPFKGDSAIATGIQHLTGKVPKLPLIFRAYQQFIDRALAKDKSDRQTDADDFIAQLKLATERSQLPMHDQLSELRTSVADSATRVTESLHCAQTSRKRHLALISGVIVVVGIISVVWVWVSRVQVGEITAGEERQESGESSEPATLVSVLGIESETQEPGLVQDPLAEQLAAARSLWLNGSWFDGDENAVGQYQAILATDPQRTEAISALQDILDTTIKKANSQLQEKKFDSLGTTLSQVRIYWPDDRRLQALNNALSAAQKRKRESARKTAEQRAREQARLLRVENMLEKAIVAENANKLVEPENDNAFYFYQAVLADDPGHNHAKLAITKIKETLLERIAMKANNESIDSSDQQLAKLEKLYPDDSSIAMLRTMLENRRQIASQQQVQQEQLSQETQKMETSRQNDELSGTDDSFRIPGF